MRNNDPVKSRFINFYCDLNPASVEFAEDLPVPARQTGARQQGRRRTTVLQVLATQIR